MTNQRIDIPQELDLIENPDLPGKKISGRRFDLINFALCILNTAVSSILRENRWNQLLSDEINGVISDLTSCIELLKNFQKSQ